MGAIQLWSRITPVSPATTWGPLIIIFIVSASKEAWDDYNRYLSDKKANERKIWLVKDGVRIQTAALDGETDLKTRTIPPISANLSVEQLGKVKGVIECPNPDNDIRRFDANMRLFLPIIDNEKSPLTINNTLLQSCYLRYTEWACGVAVYTGNETKSGISRGAAEPKFTAADQWYLMYPMEVEGPWYDFLIIPLRFELLCSIMIPISIKVCLQFESLLTLPVFVVLFGFGLQLLSQNLAVAKVSISKI
uniref:Phospholipid-transporting ATPase 2 n=1 Tax=Zea mays TaxID=4577 RepID=A0A804REX8_MAIZE